MLDIAEIKGMNIFDLRNLARDCGVDSPTTKRKEELINSIINIEEREELRKYSLKGRMPVVSRQSFFDMMLILKEFKNLFSAINDKKDESYFDFYKNNLSENSEVEPIVHVHDYRDFMIMFDELINGTFEAKVEAVRHDLYKLDFKYQTVMVGIKEEVTNE